MSDKLTLTTVMNKQQQIQLVQIAKDRSRVLLDQFRLYSEHAESQARLVAVIVQLEMVEAELMDDLGFDKSAEKLRNGKQNG